MREIPAVAAVYGDFAKVRNFSMMEEKEDCDCPVTTATAGQDRTWLGVFDSRDQAMEKSTSPFTLPFPLPFTLSFTLPFTLHPPLAPRPCSRSR